MYSDSRQLVRVYGMPGQYNFTEGIPLFYLDANGTLFARADQDGIDFTSSTADGKTDTVADRISLDQNKRQQIVSIDSTLQTILSEAITGGSGLSNMTVYSPAFAKKYQIVGGNPASIELASEPESFISGSSGQPAATTVTVSGTPYTAYTMPYRTFWAIDTTLTVKCQQSGVAKYFTLQNKVEKVNAPFYF